MVRSFGFRMNRVNSRQRGTPGTFWVQRATHQCVMAVKGALSPRLPTCPGQDALHSLASNKAKWKLIAVWSFVVVITKLDRGNLSFSASAVMSKLGMNNTKFGEVAGYFYVTYAIFQYPSQWAAKKVGIRLWMTMLLLSWCLICSATAFVTSQWQLAVCRLLLGAAEAGTFPTLYMHLDSYLLQHDLTSAWSILSKGMAAASALIAGPIAACFLSMQAPPYMEPYQWLMVTEGLAAAVIAGIVYFFLPDSPECTTAFTEEERQSLIDAKARESKETAMQKSKKDGDYSVLLSWPAWYMAITALLLSVPTTGFEYFTPLIVKGLLSTTAATAAALNSIPWGMEVVLALLHGETLRRLPRHTRLWQFLFLASACLLLTVAFVAAGRSQDGPGALILLSLLQAAHGTAGLNMDTLPSAYRHVLPDSDAAGAYALINTVRSVSGVIGGVLFGALADSYSGIVALAVTVPVGILPASALFAAFFAFNGDGFRACGVGIDQLFRKQPVYGRLGATDPSADEEDPSRGRPPKL